jgi:hypothetical protein
MHLIVKPVEYVPTHLEKSLMEVLNRIIGIIPIVAGLFSPVMEMLF